MLWRNEEKAEGKDNLVIRTGTLPEMTRTICLVQFASWMQPTHPRSALQSRDLPSSSKRL